MVGVVNPDAGQTLVFNGAEHNGGNHYNTSDGTFTCPKTGTYFFTVTLCSWIKKDYMYYQLVVQGRQVARIVCGDDEDAGTHVTCGNSVIVRCAATQQVYVKCTHKGPSVDGHSSDRRITFSGLLIHAD